MEPVGAAVPGQVDRAGLAWKARPFARSFDLISGAYGWTDDQVLDLTMARMRQVREVIWERVAEERRAVLTVKQFELRTLASFMAQTEEAGAAASTIQLLAPDPDEVDDSKFIPFEKAQRWFGG